MKPSESAEATWVWPRSGSSAWAGEGWCACEWKFSCGCVWPICLRACVSEPLFEYVCLCVCVCACKQPVCGCVWWMKCQLQEKVWKCQTPEHCPGSRIKPDRANTHTNTHTQTQAQERIITDVNTFLLVDKETWNSAGKYLDFAFVILHRVEENMCTRTCDTG